MTLPGKLCIGMLEEDNPQKAYFRFKPVLVESEGRFIRYEGGDAYPKDGCIRVVPDKNESFQFKARMRRMGLFCVVDLRAHPEDNDKIRPNKNFRDEGPERNAFILYSDAVKEPLPRTLFEVLPAGTPDALRPRPHAAHVLMRGDGDAPLPAEYAWEAVHDAEGWARLVPTGEACPLDRAQLFDLTDFSGDPVTVAILPPPTKKREPTPTQKPPQKPSPLGGSSDQEKCPVDISPRDRAGRPPVGGAAQSAVTDEVVPPDNETTPTPAPIDEPSQKPSPGGEGGAAQSAVTDEVSPPASTPTDEPTQKPSPLGKGSSARETAQCAVSSENGPVGPGGTAEQVTDEVPSNLPHENPANPVDLPASQKPSPLGKGSSARETAQCAVSSENGPVGPGGTAQSAVTDEVSPPAPTPTDEPTQKLRESKPWLHRDDTIRPRPLDPRLSPTQRSLAAQSGMNPRRGRSLQELIDEKWQRSRLDQMGLTPAPIQTGAPVSSPVDSAVAAVREVWRQPELRQDLLGALGTIEEFGASLEERREAARRSDIERHLENLEARRLALLGEADHLSLKNDQTRARLKAELKKEAEADVAEALRRADAAKAEQAKFERLAGEARAAAEDARKAVKDMTAEALEEQLTQFALSEHMVERMQVLKDEAEPVPPAAPAVQSVDLNALAVRVVNRFDASGFAITRLEALNLCACAAIGPSLILSGPVGSGKTETARLLAEALGLTDINRYVAVAPGRKPLGDDPRLDALDACPDLPALILLDDANLYPSPDPLRGLNARLRPQWRLALTVQDDGCPLSAHALDRGFTLRLPGGSAAPWRPRPTTPCAPEAPATLALQIPDAPLPPAMEARMDQLRTALARLGAAPSRRALNDAWRYCALMRRALGPTADPAAILDRAVAQRLLPPLLAAAPLPALAALPALLEGLPTSRALLESALPVRV